MEPKAITKGGLDDNITNGDNGLKSDNVLRDVTEEEYNGEKQKDLCSYSKSS